MKTRKVIAYALLLVVILSSSFACSKSDGYSLGEFRISVATVIPEGDMNFSLLLDNGDKLLPASANFIYNPIKDQRVIVNYTLLSGKVSGYDHYIRVNDIMNVLTKPVIELTEENADSIGNDPVKVKDFWIGNNFLNASFAFNYGGLKPHAINVVQNTMKADGEGDVLQLEFRHNSYESESKILYDGFACFDLKPFREEGKDSIRINIKVKEWDKEGATEREYKLTYRYNDMSKPKTMATIPTISTNRYE